MNQMIYEAPYHGLAWSLIVFVLLLVAGLVALLIKWIGGDKK